MYPSVNICVIIDLTVDFTMSETASENSVDTEKPVQCIEDVKFPPFPGNSF